jgi:CheY-like chemotaxis protein
LALKVVGRDEEGTMGSQTAATLLLVDDNTDLLNMLTLALKTLGNYNIERATDGVGGLEQAVNIRPDCIIIDILMPGLDGYQLVRALRGDPETADIPLVILTAVAHDKGQFSGLAAGADQYLTKPASPQSLIAAIQQAMALNQQERDRRLRALAESGLEPTGEAE